MKNLPKLVVAAVVGGLAVGGLAVGGRAVGARRWWAPTNPAW